MPPPGPAISQVVWTAIISAAVIAALVTQGLQFLQNVIKRRSEIKDRNMKRTAEREDRIFDARREALVGCAQEFSEASFWVLTEGAYIDAPTLGAMVKKAKDASAKLGIYTDDVIAYQADRISDLLVVAAISWDGRIGQASPSRPREMRRAQRASYKARIERLSMLIRAELGVIGEEEGAKARKEAVEEYKKYCEIRAEAKRLGREVAYSSLTGAASVQEPTPFSPGLVDPESKLSSSKDLASD